MAKANKKAIEFMVQGALPPHDTNVLWMDTSDEDAPILKIFDSGAWISVNSDNAQAVKILSEAVLKQAQQLDVIKYLAKQGSNQLATNTAILQAIDNIDIDTSGLAQETSVKDGNDTAISMLKDIATDSEIYAMFPGAVDENGYIDGLWTVNESGYLMADFTMNNGIITLN